jgi:hypothetical protein
LTSKGEFKRFNMADEEVDWGMDENVDEWRGNGVTGGAVDDDVLSLGGEEDGKSLQSKSARNPVLRGGGVQPLFASR